MEPKPVEKRSVRILVSVTPGLKERLRQMADEQARSLSQVAYMLLMEALAKKEGRDDDDGGRSVEHGD